MPRFIEIQVEEHPELPEGCSLRFRARGEGAPIDRVMWESESGRAGIFRVVARSSDGNALAATAYAVDDSSAGTSILVVGGDHGLRLTPVGGDESETVAEPYLLVSRTALVTA